MNFFEAVGKELLKETGVKFLGPATASNLLTQSRVNVGGRNVPARAILLQTLTQLDNPSLVWRLNWDATTRAYYLNLGITKYCE